MSQNSVEDPKEPPFLRRSESDVMISNMGVEMPVRVESEPTITMKRSLENLSVMERGTKSEIGPEDIILEDIDPPTSPDRKQEKRSDGADNLTASESLRRVMRWTMTGFFDWNPSYFLQVRGVMNVIHVVLCLTNIILLSQICRLGNRIGGVSDDFICKPPETFLFVVTCGAFFTAVLYLFCCMLSKKTAYLLFNTSFEISYFVLYFILLLTASITVLVSSVSWDSYRAGADRNYHAVQASSIVGLTISIIYGLSAIWFFISHKYYDIPNGPQVQSSMLR